LTIFGTDVRNERKPMLIWRPFPGSNTMATRHPAARSNSVKANAVPTRRGRPPRKVYINVLVKATTRDGLAKLKASGSLASQGEVIDELVERILSVKARNGD